MKINLTPKLSKAQRSELEESAEHLAKLLRQIAAVEKKTANLEDVRAKARLKLAAAETAADAGDEEASTKALAIRDQLMRLGLSIGRAEQELADYLATGEKATTAARNEIRVTHASLVKPLTQEIADLIAPFCFSRHTAAEVAANLQAPSQLQLWARPINQYRHFESQEDLTAAMQSIGGTLAALLAANPVVTLSSDSEAGGLVFPACC